MPAMHTVFPEETREETGYFLCLGLVTEPCQACTEQSGDLGLTLQIHSAWGTGLWRTGRWVCREVWRGRGVLVPSHFRHPSSSDGVVVPHIISGKTQPPPEGNCELLELAAP